MLKEIVVTLTDREYETLVGLSQRMGLLPERVLIQGLRYYEQVADAVKPVPMACPHAYPHVYCYTCKVTPCPIGLGEHS